MFPGRVQDFFRSMLWRRPSFNVAPPDKLRPGVALLGYPRAEIGLGQAVRLIAKAAEHAGIPLTILDLGRPIGACQQDGQISGHISGVLDRRVNIFILSPVYTHHSIQLLGPKAIAGRRNILYAFWELPEWPAEYARALKVFDQIWAPSRFVAQALRSQVSRPVPIVPLPMALPAISLRPRADFGLPADRFLFYFFFDYSSFVERKNPQAVLAAFRRCVQEVGRGRVGLVLKSMGEGYGRDERAQLAKLIDGADDVFTIDRVLDRCDMLALQASCDCFVSLHRSEGFGLGIAEAMALGKPVVATNFGGACDLLAVDRACLVGYRPQFLTPDQYPGAKGQYWADPDIEQASAAMRRIVEQPEFAKAIAAQGRAFVERALNPSRIGAEMRQHLGQFGEDLIDGGSAAVRAAG